MNKYLKSFIYVASIILLFTFILTIFNYIGVITGTPLNIIKMIIPFISLFVGGFIVGKSSTSKGWLEGIKIGFICVLVLIILSLITKIKFNLYTIIYYIILFLLSILGGIVGINKKSSN